MGEEIARRRLPPLNALRSFEAAARHSSFLKAAAELCVTSGAVSRLVKSLEDYLRVELFERSHRGVILTEDGQEYARAISQALDSVAYATDQLLRKHSGDSLRICCRPAFALHWLIPRWPSFQAAFPNLLIDLRTSLTPHLEGMNNFDLVFQMSEEDDLPDIDGIVSERVFDFETFPVCSPDFMARNNLSSLDALRDLPFIHAALMPHDWDWWLASAGADFSVDQKGLMFDSLSLAYNAARSGIGIAMGVGAYAAPDIAAGRFVQPFQHVRRTTSGLNMYYRAAQAEKMAGLRSAIDWIRSEREKDR